MRLKNISMRMRKIYSVRRTSFECHAATNLEPSGIGGALLLVAVFVRIPVERDLSSWDSLAPLSLRSEVI